jgi:acetylornithine deacetylase
VTIQETTATEALLDRLVGFAVTSADSNLGLIDWVEHYLRSLGFAVHLVPDEGGQNAGLFASLGPRRPGGILLSAHSDVVPVDGQTWTRPAFRLTRESGRFYGRGTADMKGFLASTLAGAAEAARANLREPFKIALSYDEEVGCLGIARMIHQLEPTIGLPRLVIVGEPTLMQVAVGHKGKVVWRATVRGQAGHSALAPRFANALHPAAEFLLALREEQARLAATGRSDPDYDIPYATLHAGRMAGGVALNIVPDQATIDYELRYLPGEEVEIIDRRLRAAALEIAGRYGAGVSIGIEQVNAYPGLGMEADHPAVAEVCELAGGVGVTKVAYGTEAGYFSQAGLPVVVCGPGSMDQGHGPDEYIDRAQLLACDAMMARIVQSLSA